MSRTSFVFLMTAVDVLRFMHSSLYSNSMTGIIPSELAQLTAMASRFNLYSNQVVTAFFDH